MGDLENLEFHYYHLFIGYSQTNHQPLSGFDRKNCFAVYVHSYKSNPVSTRDTLISLIYETEYHY